MREIPLTRGMVALVDDQDYERISAHKWSAATAGYAIRGVGSHKNSRCIYMHREILGVSADEHVDHVDGNPLDNRRSNLRVCAHAQNMANRHRNSNKTSSAFKGVFPSGSKRSPWRASVRNTHLGHFTSEIEAARAYDVAALALFGEFARLNFPQAGVA